MRRCRRAGAPMRVVALWPLLLAIAGLPCTRRTWRQGDIRFTMFIAKRDRTFFAILAFGPGPEAAEQAKKLFSLLP